MESTPVHPSSSIYLDHHSTTPMDPLVLEAMLPYFSEKFGNPSSALHPWGWVAETAVERARQQVAQLIEAEPSEIIFTSGATESNHGALTGVARYFHDQGLAVHMILSTLEHKSVLETAKDLQQLLGIELTFIKPDRWGQISALELEKHLQPHTRLVSLMAGHNEIGTLLNLKALGETIRTHSEAFFHTDATQCFTTQKISTQDLPVDLISLSGHKMYGPKGIGALYIRRRNPRVLMSPFLRGGGQERGLRSGTLNVPGIVGLGQASVLVEKRRVADNLKAQKLAQIMLSYFTENLPLERWRLNGDPHHRLPQNLHFSFFNILSPQFFNDLSHLGISSGASCSGISDFSEIQTFLHEEHVKLHVADVRIGFGRGNTSEDIERASREIVEAFRRHSTTS